MNYNKKKMNKVHQMLTILKKHESRKKLRRVTQNFIRVETKRKNTNETGRHETNNSKTEIM